MEDWSQDSICLADAIGPLCWTIQCDEDGTMNVLSPEDQEMLPCATGGFVQLKQNGVLVRCPARQRILQSM